MEVDTVPPGMPSENNLLTMPPELLTCIFDRIGYEGLKWDYVSLARTCRSLHDIALSYAYHDLRLFIDPEDEVPPKWFHCLLLPGNTGLLYTRFLRIATAGEVNPQLEPPGWISQQFGDFFLRVLQRIPEGRLDSFIWSVNDDMTPEMWRMLARCQRNLKYLKCESSASPETPYSQLSFPALESLAVYRIDDLRGVWRLQNLIGNAPRLRKLEVDLRENTAHLFTSLTYELFVHYVINVNEIHPSDPAERGAMLRALFAQQLLRMGEKAIVRETKGLVQQERTCASDADERLHLRFLRLGNMELGPSGWLLPMVVDTATLGTLVLHGCNVVELLDWWAANVKTNPINLKTLLIQANARGHPEKRFLAAFSGLERLYLILDVSVGPPSPVGFDETDMDGDYDFTAVKKHRDTLKVLLLLPFVNRNLRHERLTPVLPTLAWLELETKTFPQLEEFGFPAPRPHHWTRPDQLLMTDLAAMIPDSVRVVALEVVREDHEDITVPYTFADEYYGHKFFGGNENKPFSVVDPESLVSPLSVIVWGQYDEDEEFHACWVEPKRNVFGAVLPLLTEGLAVEDCIELDAPRHISLIYAEKGLDKFVVV